MANKKTFHIADILTITTGRMVAERGFDAIRDILGFMVGEVPFTHQIPRIVKICAPHLLQQIPKLRGPEIEQEVARLDEQIRSAGEHRSLFKEIAASWRQHMAEKFGAEFEVVDLPEELRDSRDPVEELAEMREGPIAIVEFGEASDGKLN